VRLPGGGKITATRDTKAEAQEWGRQQELLKLSGKLTPSSSVTVGQLFEAFDDAVASKTDSAKWNSLRIAKWGLDPLASVSLPDVTTHHINEWIDRRVKDVSGATVNRELNLMSSAFSYAVKDRRWLEINPCHGARRPERGRPRNPPLLSPDQVEAILIATGFHRDPLLLTKTARVGACFLLAQETGARSGELLRVSPADYWKDRRTLHIAAIERGGRKSSRSGRANLDPSRNVPLTERASELLDQLLVSMPADQPYVVGLNDSQRDALWRKAIKQAGLSDVHFHDMKHEAATRLAPFLDVLALSHAIGTKDVRLLRDTYYNNDASRSAALLPRSLSAQQDPA
jgi:integrase